MGPGADPGVREEVGDELLHAGGAVHGVSDELVRVCVELATVTFAEQLGVARHHAQRLLEVVGSDIGELLEVGVGAAQVQLRPLARTDIHDRGEHEQTLVRLDRVEADLDGDFAAVLPTPEQVPSRPHRARLRASKKVRAQPGVASVHLLGDEQLDRLAQELLAGVPEQPLDLAVHQHDLAAALHHHHAVG